MLQEHCAKPKSNASQLIVTSRYSVSGKAVKQFRQKDQTNNTSPTCNLTFSLKDPGSGLVRLKLEEYDYQKSSNLAKAVRTLAPHLELESLI